MSERKINKKRKKRIGTLIILLISVIIVAAIAANFLIKTYAYQYRYEHSSDKIDMSDNSVTFTYYDNEKGKYGNKSYFIADDWLDKMTIRHEDLVEEQGTDTTIYGPYTWLPAGEYRVTFNFTTAGYEVFKYWDACVNSGGTGKSELQARNASYGKNNQLKVGNSGASIYDSRCWKDNDGAHFGYIINTSGDPADYELRLYFSSSLGYDIDDYGDNGSNAMNIKKGFLDSISIESLNTNIISFDAKGGELYDSENEAYIEEGKLTLTNWGKNREKVQVPIKEGYVFKGWWGYSKATNNSGNRWGLRFDTRSGMVKIWDESGRPTGNVKEVSYYDYTVYADWEPEQYILTIDPDGGSFYPYYRTDEDTGEDYDIEPVNEPLDIPFRYGQRIEYASDQTLWTNNVPGHNQYISGQPYKEDCEFIGWEIVSGDGSIYSREIFNYDYGYTDVVIYGYDGMNKGNVTIRAKWKSKAESYSYIIKASSTMYKDTLIRRTSGDEEWYDWVGKETISNLKEYNKDKCIQVWVIDNNGNITRK